MSAVMRTLHREIYGRWPLLVGLLALASAGVLFPPRVAPGWDIFAAVFLLPAGTIVLALRGAPALDRFWDGVPGPRIARILTRMGLHLGVIGASALVVTTRLADPDGALDSLFELLLPVYGALALGRALGGVPAAVVALLLSAPLVPMWVFERSWLGVFGGATEILWAAAILGALLVLAAVAAEARLGAGGWRGRSGSWKVAVGIVGVLGLIFGLGALVSRPAVESSELWLSKDGETVWVFSEADSPWPAGRLWRWREGRLRLEPGAWLLNAQVGEDGTVALIEMPPWAAEPELVIHAPDGGDTRCPNIKDWIGFVGAGRVETRDGLAGGGACGQVSAWGEAMAVLDGEIVYSKEGSVHKADQTWETGWRDAEPLVVGSALFLEVRNFQSLPARNGGSRIDWSEIGLVLVRPTGLELLDRHQRSEGIIGYYPLADAVCGNLAGVRTCWDEDGQPLASPQGARRLLYEIWMEGETAVHRDGRRWVLPGIDRWGVSAAKRSEGLRVLHSNTIYDIGADGAVKTWTVL